jgi:hypothetical protein
MDEMGIEVQNLFWALSGSAWSAEGKANELPEPFSSLLGGLKEKKGEIPLIGQKGGEFGSRGEEEGIEAWEALWKESPLLFFPKKKSLMGMKRPGGEQLSMDITSPFSRKKDLPLDPSPFGEKKTDPPRDEIPEVISENSLGTEKFAGEVPRTKEPLPLGMRSSDSELWNLMGLSWGEAIPQLNATASGLEVYGAGPVGVEKEISPSPFQARESSGLSGSISSATPEISKDRAQDGEAVRAFGLWAQIHGNGETDKGDLGLSLGPSLRDPGALSSVVGPRIEGPRGPLSEVRGSFPSDTKNGKWARGQEEIGAIGGKEAGKLDASAGAVEAVKSRLSGPEPSQTPVPRMTHLGSIGELALSEVHQVGENQSAFPSDSDGLGRPVAHRTEGPRGALPEVRGSFPSDTKNGKWARGQEEIGAIGGKEAGKLDASLAGFEVKDLSLPVIESLESSGQAKGPSSSPMEVAPQETSMPDMAFGARDSKSEASQEGPLREDGSSVSTQGLKTPSPMEESRPELSRFPGIAEEKRSRGEPATFKGPRRESPSIKREELGQLPEMRPPEPGSLLSKDGPLLGPSKGETAQVNGFQRLLQPHGRELGEGPFQTVQIVFKEAEDLTRIRLRLHQNNLDALFVVTSAEKKSELEANLGQLQRELFQSGFLPHLAVEVGGRYANSGFQKDTPLYSYQESETGGRDIHEEVLLSGLNPLDGSIHLTV